MGACPRERKQNSVLKKHLQICILFLEKVQLCSFFGTLFPCELGFAMLTSFSSKWSPPFIATYILKDSLGLKGLKLYLCESVTVQRRKV